MNSRYRRALFDEGKVFVAVPPLYKVKGRGSTRYCYNDEEMFQWTKDRKPGSFTVQRFKGLGEMMPTELWETTLNPETRILRRLKVRDALETDKMFNILMGDKVQPRRKLIEEEGHKLGLSDLDI